MSIKDLTSEERSIELRHTIDPGFVNQRLAGTILGPKNMELVNRAISQLPELPSGLLDGQINHVFSRFLLLLCEKVGVKTLGELLASGNGTLFCSTETLLPCPEVYDKPRVESTITPQGNTEYKVILEYGTEHIRSSTVEMELHDGGVMSVIAKFWKKEGETLYFHPIVMGAPWTSHENESIDNWAMWEGFDFYEHFVEDFDEFSKADGISQPADFTGMKAISENAFKQCLAKILNDDARKDWGGEMSDHFTSHIHLKGRRCTAAFLLKGPAYFAPMGLNHLGKNNDQIYRLTQEPAQVFFVQHCHEITAPVRATLRAFAVQPGNPRRYCIIDGKDSFRLLQAYDLLDEAIALSRK